MVGSIWNDYLDAQRSNPGLFFAAVMLEQSDEALTSSPKEMLVASAIRGGGHLAERAIKRGAPINLDADNGFTVLMTAVVNGHMDVVKVLIAAGIRVNARTKRGLTALAAAEEINREDIANMLRAHGAKSGAMSLWQRMLDA